MEVKHKFELFSAKQKENAIENIYQNLAPDKPWAWGSVHEVWNNSYWKPVLLNPLYFVFSIQY